MEDELLKVVEEIENEKALGRVSAVEVFRSMLNQPSLVAISSANQTFVGSAVSFSKFSIDLPRPVLEAQTIQLVSANMPSCTQNIPDTACGFWYYRLSAYEGSYPTLNNLYWCRLLPSYYKKELIDTPAQYGYNETFNSYSDLQTQLELATKTDLANEFWKDGDVLEAFFKSKFLPYDIAFNFEPTMNKFQMTGLNVYQPPAYLEWDSATAYAVGQKVYAGTTFNLSYTCILANTGQSPLTTTGYWVEDNGPIIQAWDNTISYNTDRIVEYEGLLYISVRPALNLNHNPATATTWWEEIEIGSGTRATDFCFNRYLIAGFNDPNVALAQKKCFMPYTPTTLFEEGDVVDYSGAFYSAVRQTQGVGIPSADWTLQSTAIRSATSIGPLVSVYCDTTLFTGVAMGTPVYIVENANQNFNIVPNDSYNPFEITYTLSSVFATYITLQESYGLFTGLMSGTGGRVCLAVAQDIGLQSFSGQFDFTNSAVFGVPPQPLNPVPKRLLNSILGFTWNGVFSLGIFPPDWSVNNTLVIENSLTTFFNKIRPVPLYFPNGVLLGAGEGGADVPQTARVYTADGYANLNYSSIISIYASLVAGSTLNTNTNTGLLAMGTMNCSNLGVSYFSPYISNPLWVAGADIYSIEIDMRDEFDEPYIFTNNAVISLSLKVAYEKKSIE